MDKIIQSARIEYIQKAQICSDCGKTMRDVFSIKNNKGVKTLMIKDIEIGNKEFDEFNKCTDSRKKEYLGGRFAAKEAFLKANKKGIGEIPFHEIEVLNDESGAPYVNNSDALISISHEKLEKLQQKIQIIFNCQKFQKIFRL